MALDTTIGGASADSYATLAEYTARAAAMGWTLAETDAENEINLRRAAVAIEATYAEVFVGIRQYDGQALSWPRTWVGWVLDFDIDPDTIPPRVKDAQMEMAYLIQNGADPLANVTAGIRAEDSQVGSLRKRVEYAGAKTLPRYTVVDRLLRPFTKGSGGQVAVRRA